MGPQPPPLRAPPQAPRKKKGKIKGVVVATASAVTTVALVVCSKMKRKHERGVQLHIQRVSIADLLRSHFSTLYKKEVFSGTSSDWIKEMHFDQ